MSDSLERLDPELAALVAADVDSAGMPPPAHARVRGRVFATLGLPPIGPGSGGDPAGGGSGAGGAGPASSGANAAGSLKALGASTKLWGTGLVATAALSGTIYLAGARSDGPTPARPAPVEATAPNPGAPAPPRPDHPAPVPSMVDAAQGQTTVAEPPATTPPGARSAPELRTAGTEADTIRRAATALARGDAPATLAALDAHAATYPDGAHAEERDALRVRALVLAERWQAAHAAAARFLDHYPASIHRAAVERASDTIPDNPGAAGAIP
jgi:hypothetical protein